MLGTELFIWTKFWLCECKMCAFIRFRILLYLCGVLAYDTKANAWGGKKTFWILAQVSFRTVPQHIQGCIILLQSWPTKVLNLWVVVRFFFFFFFTKGSLGLLGAFWGGENSEFLVLMKAGAANKIYWLSWCMLWEKEGAIPTEKTSSPWPLRAKTVWKNKGCYFTQSLAASYIRSL